MAKPRLAHVLAAPRLVLPLVHGTSPPVVAQLMPRVSVPSRGARMPLAGFRAGRKHTGTVVRRPHRRRVRLRRPVVGLLPAVAVPVVATPEALPTVNLPRRRRFPF